MDQSVDPTWGVALGDLNGDGDLDVAFASTEPRACLGDGQGVFQPCQGIDFGGGFATKLALGDVNGDRILDVVFAMTSDGANRVCPGDGGGGFLPCYDLEPDLPYFVDTSDVALGDLDGDGDTDVVTATRNTGIFLRQDRVCLNDGAGDFECSDVDDDNGLTTVAILAHLDGDTRLDALFLDTSSSRGTRTCLGDGAGGFSTCFNSTPHQGWELDAALGDLDHDGHLDVVFAVGVSAPWPDTNRVCRGTGAGDFTGCTDVGPEEVDTFSVALGDVNRDGDLDAVFGNADAPNQICLGNGIGGFLPCSEISGESFENRDVALGPLIVRGIFTDGFESGDTSAWSTSVP